MIFAVVDRTNVAVADFVDSDPENVLFAFIVAGCEDSSRLPLTREVMQKWHEQAVLYASLLEQGSGMGCE